MPWDRNIPKFKPCLESFLERICLHDLRATLDFITVIYKFSSYRGSASLEPASMPLQRSQRTPEPEEATPLLCDGNPLQKNTPLPITQILVLLMLQLTEPITSLSINPYINQVRS
jgi:hypothetical protein